MSTPSPARIDAGMSLIEVTVALSVLVLGALSVFSAMGTANEVKNRARSHGLAVEAIQAQIERLQATNFTEVYKSVPAAPGGQGFDVEGIQLQPGDVNAGRISREADSTNTLLHLTVTVDWWDAQGNASLTVHYYHVNRGG